MKVVVNSEQLHKVLRRAELSKGSNVNPIHALVKIEAKAEPPSLAFTSTMGLMQINTSILAKVDEPGVVTANTKALLNAAGAMPAGGTKIETDATRIRLTGSNGRRWSGAVANDALGATPEPEAGVAHWLRVPIADLRRGIERVGHSSGDIRKEEQRGPRDGVKIEAAPGTLVTVGLTDRMCVTLAQSSEVELKAESWVGLIPSMALAPLRDIFDEALEEEKTAIDLYEDGRFLYIMGPNTLLVVALPIGEYPPWQLMLSNFPTEPHAVLARLPLIEALKACQATSLLPNSSALYSLEGGNVRVFRRDPDNEFSDTVPVVTMRPNLRMLMRSDIGYLTSCLTAADEDPELSVGDDAKMVLLRTHTGYRAAFSLQDPEKGVP